jgi:hypothetical protein
MRTFWSISAALCVLGAVSHAQDASRTPPVPPAPAHNVMVLTGCLTTGSDESLFKLSNAKPDAQASAAQPQAVGTSGDRAEYELRAETNLDKTGVAAVDLKRFVGHQVEVTARAEEIAAAPSPAATGDAKTDADPAKPVEKIEKKDRPLTVTAVKQIAANCR